MDVYAAAREHALENPLTRSSAGDLRLITRPLRGTIADVSTALSVNK